MESYIIGSTGTMLKDCHYHSHDGWEVIVNTSGFGDNLIDDKLYPFSPGTICCIPPNMMHKKSSEDGFFDIALQISPDIFHEKVSRSLLTPVFFEDDADHTMEQLFNTLLHLHYKNHSAAASFLVRAILQLLQDQVQSDDIDPVIDSIITRMIHSFSDPECNLEELLAESSFSSDYIRRRFKKACGVTPSDYLENLRITYGRELLEQNHMLHYSINEISYLCGFYDAHYFSRVFRKKCGISPKEYEKSHTLG